MVSSGVVSSDSDELRQLESNYMSRIEELSSWKGDSHDNLVNKCSEFDSDMQQVAGQINSFASAVSLYENYKQVKDNYNSYASAYNQSISNKDNSLASQYANKMSECQSKMTEYANKINNALAAASSFIMEGAKIDTSPKISTTGGEFVAESSSGVFGHIVSSIDGKTHTIYNQMQISGWESNCNRAAAASIASAYASYNGEAVDIAKKSQNGIGYNSSVTNSYFSNFGLCATVNRVQGSYDGIKDDIVSTLSNGNYVMFDLSESNVRGASGQKWTSKRHWVSVLDIKKIGSGENDYAIFISDSGHGGSTADHGYGAGWYSLNEFSGQRIENFTTVSCKS